MTAGGDTDFIREFAACDEDQGARIDVFLTGRCSDLSRSHVQRLIKDGNALVGQKVVKANYKVSPGDQVTIRIPFLRRRP